jgi:hypothetical protein
MVWPPNPVAVPAVTYMYQFYLPSSEQLRSPARRKARGLLSGSPVTSQEIGYDRFPMVANGWGTKHPLPNAVPPLLTEEDGPPT